MKKAIITIVTILISSNLVYAQAPGPSVELGRIVVTPGKAKPEAETLEKLLHGRPELSYSEVQEMARRTTPPYIGQIGVERKQEPEPGEVQYEKTPINKLERGIVNAGLCWAEIPKTIFDVSEAYNPFVGVTFGLVKGIAVALWRGAAGVVDGVTSVVPPYDEPAVEPEYPFKIVNQKFLVFAW